MILRKSKVSLKIGTPSSESWLQFKDHKMYSIHGIRIQKRPFRPKLNSLRSDVGEFPTFAKSILSHRRRCPDDWRSLLMPASGSWPLCPRQLARIIYTKFTKALCQTTIAKFWRPYRKSERAPTISTWEARFSRGTLTQARGCKTLIR